MSVKVTDFTKEQRQIIVTAIDLKHQSVMRAMRAEGNADIRAIRQREADELLVLQNMFRI